MTLNTATKKRLRAQAHLLKPVVMIGQHGYTAAITAAIDEALGDLEAESVALVGGVATLYRRRPKDPSAKSS
jgi:RNA-binding protein YhbY